MRELVGGLDVAFFDNPTGAPIWDDVPPGAWDTYLDFGSGCGKSARRLMLQSPRPRRYIGVDIHAGMVRWCQDHLAPHAPEFEFVYHPVYNAGLNPDRTLPWGLPLPVETGTATLVEASSVFTHLIESQAEFYLDEMARVLAPDGMFISTWFLFDKTYFPFMQDAQNGLYINDRDPTNAVVFDRSWLYEALAERGLAIVRAEAPAVRGFHWRLRIVRAGDGVESIDLPADEAPLGRQPPPLLRAGAHRIGLDPEASNAAISRVRQPMPLPDPLALELANAKEYIASLEAALNASLREREALARHTSGQSRLRATSPVAPRRLVLPSLMSPSDIRERVEELAPWYQNIDLGNGIWTKDLDGSRDIFSSHDIPAPLWQAIAADLPRDLAGYRVLDIGCNAGYMSFEVKRLGAAYVLGIDSNLGAATSFISQAEFCRSVLDLDVDFREQSFFDFDPKKPFDLVLFCGVLYHLEDYATALDKVRSFAVPGTGLIVLETAVEDVTLTLPGGSSYHGDTSTFFVPSMPVLVELIRERDFQLESVRPLGTRALVFMRPPA